MNPEDVREKIVGEARAEICDHPEECTAVRYDPDMGSWKIICNLCGETLWQWESLL